ncbi:hypothetical protein [Psychroflexus gondwanensis]|jgi:hypothetical protein|uniref:hypothetical protein n=1 Tax=Psychroflexus gondwanensis TaxID=251 RepID=UPI001680CF8C|nr:hypothetical protein [Psychroflexus gondwanensis]
MTQDLVRNDQIAEDIELFGTVILDNTNKTPEQIIFGTDLSDFTHCKKGAKKTYT